MGIFKKTLQVLQDVTSAGGTCRIRNQNARYVQLQETYDRLRDRISHANTALVAAIAVVQHRVKVATRHLRAATSILTPVGHRVDHELVDGTWNKEKSVVQATSLSPRPVFNAMDTSVPTVVGAGAGGGTATGSWGAVQLVGHASTGAAMAHLHGAAAANAGWAWFGGGSLAAGGGGMAAGHFILPGIGTAVAIAISATISHRRANHIADLCAELEGVNRNNSSVLSKSESDLSSVNRLEAKLRSEDLRLCEATRTTRLKVRPFGWFSHFRRLLRFWIEGYYYTQEEFVFVVKLDAAVLRFVTAFKTIEA